MPWKQRETIGRHSWISEGLSKELTAKYTITFIMGKGNSLVWVLLPRNCEKAMVILAGSADRAHAGISPKNDFLFAYTQQSVDSDYLRNKDVYFVTLQPCHPFEQAEVQGRERRPPRLSSSPSTCRRAPSLDIVAIVFTFSLTSVASTSHTTMPSRDS